MELTLETLMMQLMLVTEEQLLVEYWTVQQLMECWTEQVELVKEMVSVWELS